MTYYIRSEYAPATDGIYIFEKKIDLPSAREAELCIFAASRYVLTINGQYICEGPCRSHERVRYFDRISCRLSAGENVVSVKVMHVTSFFTTVYDTPTPQLALEATSQNEPLFATDKTWTCSYLNAYTLIRHDMKSLPPYERYDAHFLPTVLSVVETDRAFFRSDGYFTGGGAAYPYILEERPIPMILPQEPASLRLLRKGEGYAEYDAGMYVTAKVSFALKKNSSVKIIYAECFSFEDGKHRRDDMQGTLKGYFDTVTSSDTDMEFETFWFRSFRYIRVEGNADATSALRMHRIHYPFDIQGRFECSDPTLNQMFEVSKNTLLACCHEIIVDCPYYEQQQYEFDSCVQTAALTALTDDMRLTRKCIAEFAYSQQPCGLLLSIYPASWALQIIPSYSLIWIMMLRRYLDQSADYAFAARYLSVADAVLGFFDRQMQECGYLHRTRYWDFFDWVPEWKNGTPPICENETHTLYHFYYAVALEDAAYIADAMSRPALASEYRARKKVVLERVRRDCYRPSKGMYSDGSATDSFSMHTSLWAILADAVDSAAKDAFLQNLYRADISKTCFAMNFFLFRALEKCKRFDLAFDFLDGWKWMLANGCTSWCENPDSPRSECHGWSCAPLYDFATNILGVQVSLKDEILICPTPRDLAFAKGTVPTRFGIVSISLENNEDSFFVQVAAPADIQKRLILPNGEVHIFTEKCAKYSYKK